MIHRSITILALLTLSLVAAACGKDASGTPADRVGVAAQCTVTADCPVVDFEGDAGSMQLECITSFKGGYCGLANCTTSAECPAGSICVAHDDPVGSFCFRSCADKPECNVNRDPANEANCSSSFTWQVPAEDDGSKACIPSSSGL